MEHIKSSVFAKVLAIFLFVITGLSTVLGIVAAVYLEEEGVYAGGSKQFAGTYWEQEISESYKDILYRYIGNKMQLEPGVEPENWKPDTEAYQLRMAHQLNPANTNFCYRVTDTTDQIQSLVMLNNSMKNVPVVYQEKFYHVYVIANGKIIYSTTTQSVAVAKDEIRRAYGDPIGMITTYFEYTVEYGMNPVVSKVDSYYYANLVYEFCVTYCYELIYATVASAILWVLLLTFLLCAAGHKKGEDKIVPNVQDAIPFDLYLAVFAGIVVCVCLIIAELSYYITLTQMLLLLIPIASVIGFVLLAALLMTFATRCKAKTLFRNTICGYIIRFCIKVVKKVWAALMSVIRNIPYIWVQLCVTIVFTFINLLLVMVVGNGIMDGAVFCWLMLQFAMIAVVIYCSLCMNKVMRGAKKLAEGQQRTRVATGKMVLHYKDLAENLNHLGEGMERAVAEQVKSERMKTELITNVSHDLKTPITSLINYVDLLKKEEIVNETAKEYIEVLERQAVRLKKLTEDLVEASKASTGNISVNIAPTDVVELLHQSIAEYSEQLEACRLTPMVNAPLEKVVIPADGRLLWRIYDNLLSNICKYSLPNTRVYFDVALSEEQVQITAKNISREILNISADELKERFVRGDSARHTEGSGLGLSIAESLTQLQGGSFHLFVDGDLFKAVLVFSRLETVAEAVEEPEETEEWVVGNVADTENEMREADEENLVVKVYTAPIEDVEITEAFESSMEANGEQSLYEEDVE